MPSETDLYFPLTDAQYEKQFMKTVTFAPIHSIWGHPAGAAANPEDKAYLNEQIARFLAAGSDRR
jgi:homoserine O-acetyltransferase